MAKQTRAFVLMKNIGRCLRCDLVRFTRCCLLCSAAQAGTRTSTSLVAGFLLRSIADTLTPTDRARGNASDSGLFFCFCCDVFALFVFVCVVCVLCGV